MTEGNILDAAAAMSATTCRSDHPPSRIARVDAKKTPSSREYQLLAVLVRNEWSQGKGAELNGRQIAKAYEQEVDERIPSGTVYTLLAAMEEWEWVKSRENIHEGRRTRWYWLTKRGTDAVERWRERAAVLLQLTDPAPAKGAKAARGAKTRAGG